MAYIIENKATVKTHLVPLRETLGDGTEIILDYYVDDDVPTMHKYLNDVIADGMTYPQIETLSLEGFKAYYLAGSAFVAKETKTNKIVGMFYIKPNYPGRCSHICNGGFVVPHEWRGKGIATFLGMQYLKLAPALGYRASMFNLVFSSNAACVPSPPFLYEQTLKPSVPKPEIQSSVKIWKNLGFKHSGTVPKAGLLKDGQYHDAFQFYYDFTDPNFNKQ